MYAVVSSGGKQYRVEAGSELVVERLSGEAGSTITFDRVLLVGDGEDVTVGTPTVAGASVSGTLLGEVLGPKLIVFKFKQKATYRRKNGHRQHLTRVRIDEISAGGKGSKARAAKADADEPKADKPKAKAASDTKADEPKADKPKKAASTRSRASKADATADEKKPATRKRATKAKAAEAEE